MTHLVDGRCPYCTGHNFEVVRLARIRLRGEELPEELKSICLSCGASYPVENVDGVVLREVLGDPTGRT